MVDKLEYGIWTTKGSWLGECQIRLEVCGLDKRHYRAVETVVRKLKTIEGVKIENGVLHFTVKCGQKGWLKADQRAIEDQRVRARIGKWRLEVLSICLHKADPASAPLLLAEEKARMGV